MKATALSDSLNQSKLHFIDIDGVRTRYYEDGAGTPLLLLHGGEYGSMYSLDSWSLNLPALAQRFHVYALDKLGQGFTDGPRNKDYTFEALLAHTLAFMQKVGFSRGCIAGHSRGGFLATCIAMEQPELVEKLIIVDSATASPDQPNFDSGAFYRSLGVTGIRPPVDEPVTEEIVRREPDAQAVNKEQVTEDFVRRMSEIARRPESLEISRDMLEAYEPTWLASLNRKRQEIIARIESEGIGQPTLMVWGFNDRSAPLFLGHQLFERICARTPQAEMHVLNGAGHYSFRDQWEAFNSAIISFCSR